ncbi:hypothetical protein Cflav_PD5198 [Pedosphaera parvula Ellin514]|uniref:Uncharacterized protein n=1 Tax=Pedosphaera parvula (strain Ellin514) TaxID=320771 RepID=B9XC95_PEDPL|nr:hypothetical protein Cflav_PD5198 [Pedosphaera parvula Ellin514]
MQNPQNISNHREERIKRRRSQRRMDRINEEKNRQKAMGGGQPNELGVTQGQNGEQGNTIGPASLPRYPKASH